jgi:hypothetical protein
MARILAAITFVTWFSSPACAEDAVAATAAEPRIRIQAQFELLLPAGFGRFTTGNTSSTVDMANTYAIGGSFDYALTSHLSIGVAPRLVFNVDGKDDPSADKELDLRACIRGRSALSPGFDVYASFSPGYATLLSGSLAVYSSKGFAIGGAVGFTYDLSRNLFVGSEIGFQRSFTTTHRTFIDDSIVYDFEVSYLHMGIGAGMQF